MEEATFSLAQARFDAGDYSQLVMENAEESKNAQHHIETTKKRIPGGKSPTGQLPIRATTK